MRRTYLILALVSFGCDSVVGAPQFDLPVEVDPVEPQQTDRLNCDNRAPVGVSVPARLLSAREYNNAVQLLFPQLSLPAQRFTFDARVEAFVSNAVATVTEAQVVEYREAAEFLSPLLGDAVDDLVPCTGEESCVFGYINDLGRRAFRRPLSAAEDEGLRALYVSGAEDSHVEGMRRVFEAILQAPSFIYVIENRGNALDGFDVAQRLSALVARTIPDSELLRHAEDGTLLELETRRAQARRLLESAQGLAAQQAFAIEWFGLDGLANSQFALDEPDLARWFLDEARMLSQNAVVDGATDLRELFAADYTFVNAELAAHYGYSLDGAEAVGDGWYRVQREGAAGLLTQGGFLASHHGPTHRGWRIRDVVLCSSVPGPAGVDITEIENYVGESQRSRAEKRMDHASCQSCHRAMDTIGLTLDNYDEVGVYRTEDEYGNALRSEGSLVGTDVDGTVNGPQELSERLLESAQVRKCFAENLYTWAYAKRPSEAAECEVQEIEESLVRNEFDLRETLIDIAVSDAFVLTASAP